MFTIAKFIADLFGWDISKVQRWLAIILIVLIGVAVLAFGLWMKSCFHKEPKLDQEAIIKAQQAIAANDRKQMIEVLANSDAKQAAIDQTVDNAKAATINAAANSRATWANANNADIAAELERRSHE